MDETEFNKAASSTIYFIAGVTLIGFLWGLYWGNFSLSKAGDFMSGVVAPVAIFWLMQVYRLQMREIAKVFKLQGEIKELEERKLKSSDSQNEIAKRQNKISEISFEPMFTAKFRENGVTFSGNGKHQYTRFLIFNHKTNFELTGFEIIGCCVYNLQLSAWDNEDASIHSFGSHGAQQQTRKALVRKQDHLEIQVLQLAPTPQINLRTVELSLKLFLRDELNRKWSQTFYFVPTDGSRGIPELAWDCVYTWKDGQKIGVQICPITLISSPLGNP